MVTKFYIFFLLNLLILLEEVRFLISFWFPKLNDSTTPSIIGVVGRSDLNATWNYSSAPPELSVIGCFTNFLGFYGNFLKLHYIYDDIKATEEIRVGGLP